MKKTIQIENKHIKAKEQKIKSSKKILCTKEDDSSSDRDEVSESET
jgi:hypothetical protein